MIRRIKLLFLFALLFAISCAEPNINNNLRLLTKGKIVDENLTPVENILVEVSLDNDNSLELDVNEGWSDVNGDFVLTTLYGNNDFLDVNFVRRANYSPFALRIATTDYIPDNLIFNLGDIQMKKTGNFNLNVTQISSITSEIQIQLRYQIPYCFQYYEGDLLIEEQSDCYRTNTQSFSLGIDNPDLDINIFTPLQSNVELTYSINGEPEISEVITVNQDDLSYEINY